MTDFLYALAATAIRIAVDMTAMAYQLGDVVWTALGKR